MKTVAMYNPTLKIGGGVECVTATLLRMFSQEGYHVVFFNERNERSRHDYPLPTQVKQIALPPAEKSVDRDKAWREIIVTEGVELVIYHQFAALSLQGDCLAVKSAGVPFVVVIHDPFSRVRYGGEPWLSQVKQARFSGVDCLVCLSHPERVWWGSVLGVPSIYIPNPVPFMPKPGQASPAKENMVVWIGRFAACKRLDDAISAFSLVVQRLPDAKMIVLGSSSSNSVDRRYKRLVDKLGLRKHVEFMGTVSDVASILSRATVHVMSSLNESFSLALAETQAYGVPTVMYELPCLALLESGKGYIAVEQGNVRKLADGLISVLLDKSLHDALAAEAVENLKGFGQERVMKDWKALFDAIIDGKLGNLLKNEAVGNDKYARFVLLEMERSWRWFMRENYWRLKVFEKMASFLPMEPIRAIVRKKRQDFFEGD